LLCAAVAGTVSTAAIKRDAMAQKWVDMTPNVRANRPAEAGSVSLVRDDAPCASDQAYAACRSGSG
jgi:hypothetical protein